LFQALIQFVANAFASIRFMQAPMVIPRATDTGTEWRRKPFATSLELRQMKLFMKIDKCS
jgi:hypothetical protein